MLARRWKIGDCRHAKAPQGQARREPASRCVCARFDRRGSAERRGLAGFAGVAATIARGEGESQCSARALEFTSTSSVELRVDYRRDARTRRGVKRGVCTKKSTSHGGSVKGMETLLQRWFMSDDVPTPSRGIYIAIEIIALGCVLTGIDDLDKEHIQKGACWIGAGIILLFVGISGLTRYFKHKTPTPNEGSEAKVKSPSLLILNAKYGTGSNWVDVTKEVKRVVEESGGSVLASHAHLRTQDPIHGKPKTLEIQYTIDGREINLSIPENETINLLSEQAENRRINVQDAKPETEYLKFFANLLTAIVSPEKSMRPLLWIANHRRNRLSPIHFILFIQYTNLAGRDVMINSYSILMQTEKE
jgi:hypothetical protein